MLKSPLLHPELLAALASAGHGAKILIADGNYPFSTKANPAAKRVYLNLTPGVLNATDVMQAIIGAVPIEGAEIMLNAEGREAPIIAEFRKLLGIQTTVIGHERFAFYNACAGPDTALVIATAEQRIYANILLTIGVVAP
jgi:L-fucose mutarotase